MNVHVFLVQMVQSSGVPLIIAVGATTIPVLSEGCYQLKKQQITLFASLARLRNLY